MKALAILLTVHNRRENTLRCLQCVNAQLPVSGVEADIYMTDDGCTDGTAETVSKRFPEVRIIKGDGGLYWNRGMIAAWEAAAKQTTPAATVQSSAPVEEKTDAEWHAYFREIIQSEFPGYDVRENVPVTELAGFAADEAQLYKSRPRQVYKAEWGEPYTFVLSQGGAPKGIVMLGGGHSHSANVKYLVARMYAKKLGLPYINFYTQMPNERGYVVGRIHKYLG